MNSPPITLQINLTPRDYPNYRDILPRIISRIEKEDIPEGQRGYYDMNDSMRK